MGYSTQQGWTSGYKSNSSSSSNKSSSNKSTTSTTQNRYAATSGSSSKNTVAVPSSSASYSIKSTGGSSSSSSNKSSSSSGSSSSLNRYNTTSPVTKSSTSSSSSSSNKSSGSTSSVTQNRAVATGSTSTARSTSSSSSSKSNSSSAKSTTSAAKTATAAKTTSPTQNRAAATTTKVANSSNATKNTSATQNRYNAVKKAAVTSPTLSRYYATKTNDNNDNKIGNVLTNALKSLLSTITTKPLSDYTNKNDDNSTTYSPDAYARRITNQNQVANPSATSTAHTSKSGNIYGGGGGNRTFGTGTTRPTIVINDEPRSATPSNVPDTNVKILSYPTDAYARRTTNQNQIANPLSTSNANINPQGYNSLPWNKAGNAAPGSEVIIPSKDNFGIPQNVLAAAAEAATNGTGRAKIQGDYIPTGNKVTNPSVPNNTITDNDLIYGDDGTNADLEEYLNGDGQITLDDVMALIEQYGPSGAYNSYPWMKSELQNYLNNAISTLNTQGTNFQNRLNDSFSNLLLNQQLSNMKNNASGFTSGEMSGAVLANNILGNQSLANSMNEASKEYWADLISQANTLAQQESNIPTDALSALNNTYTDNIANMLAEYLTGYNYGNVASKVNGIYNNWDSKRNYDVNLRALNKKS